MWRQTLRSWESQTFRSLALPSFLAAAHDVQGHCPSTFKSQQACPDAEARKQGFLQGLVHQMSRHYGAGDNMVFFSTGTRQAYLPGGLRTGAPGKHVVSGKAKYRLVDEQVRYFVAPSIEDLNTTPVGLRVKQWIGHAP